MANPNDHRKRNIIDDEDDSGGGQSGSIEFHDFLSTGTTKLSAIEEKQKLAEHKVKNSSLLEKTEKLRKDRQDLKEGRAAGYQYGAGQSAAEFSYKKHPTFEDSAQFNDADSQVNWDPNRNKAETNSEEKEELTYQQQLRFKLENQNKFIPPKPIMG